MSHPPRRGSDACPSGVLPVARRTVLARQVEGGVDQRHVREGLREIADHALRAGIVLLRQQADVVAQRRAVARTSPRASSRRPMQRVVVGQPEGAQQERPLAGGQPVDGWAYSAVAVDEAVASPARVRSPPPCRACADRRRQKADQRQHQQARVERPSTP